MADAATARKRPPAGTIVVCVVLLLYGLFWLLTGLLAMRPATVVVAALAFIVAVGLVLLAVLLYRGHRTAWWIAIAFFAASTLWRLSLLVGGERSNVLNAIVGVLLLLCLLSTSEFYQPTLA